MEIRHQRILLIAPYLGFLLALFSLNASAKTTAPQTASIEPQIERQIITEDKLDTEDFSFSLSGGILSIEDFGSHPWLGGQLAFHITPDVYLAAEYSISKAGLTSFEKLSGAAPLLTDEQRDWQYYGVQAGYILFPGETFLTQQFSMNNALSFFAGGGTTTFAGDKVFTIHFGTQYRVYLTDWATLDIGMSDYVYQTTITGESKNTHNLNFSLGMGVYF